MHGSATDIVIEDGYAYLSVNNKGLYIVDISSPSSPIEVGHYEDTAAHDSVGIYGNSAFLGGYGNKLKIIDIEIKSSPQLLNTFSVTHYTQMEVIGQYAYCSSQLGLEIVNISNPALPDIVAFFGRQDNSHWFNDVEIQGNYM